ncbi:MAG: GNAT superfamily N-acetyltransferase [Saprospiraceae bacterium]|jgi:GNAT superfamily N-acetyltransferase
MEIIVRKANFEDLHYIYDLVKELAVYEEAEDQVTASLEDYQNDFKENIFESLVAIADGKIIGMMLYYMTYSTWKGKMIYLEDFIISEMYRNKGVGQQLFDAFLMVAKDKNARLAKWQVLDWNSPAIKFYEKNNAIIEKNWWSVKIFLTN